MRGPAPKPAEQRRRRNKTTTARTLHALDPSEVEIPSLPDIAREWHSETLAWWEAVWSSPMSPEFAGDADIRGLIHVAILEDDFWCATTSAERVQIERQIQSLRQSFGLTPMDRRRLQWEIERGEDASERTQQRRTPKQRSDPRVA